MKKILSIMLAAVMMFALVACTASKAPTTSSQPEKSGDKILIGAIYRDLTQMWFDKESTAAKAAAAKLGIDIVVGDAQEDPAVLIDVLNGLITQGIQGLIINTCDQGLSKTIVDKCADAGIPVVAVDVPLMDEEGNYLAPAVILDSYLCGQQTAGWLCDAIEENGGISETESTGFLVLAMETVTSCIPRADGQFDYIKEKYTDFPTDNIFRVDYGAGASDDGYNATAATITAHPEIKTWYVVSGNDEGVVGAARYLEEVGLDKEAICVGIDGYLAADEFKKDTSPVKASAYLQSSTVAEVSVKALYEKIKNGTEIFKEYKKDGKEFGVYPFGSVIITKDNYKEVMGDDAK